MDSRRQHHHFSSNKFLGYLKFNYIILVLKVVSKEELSEKNIPSLYIKKEYQEQGCCEGYTLYTL